MKALEKAKISLRKHLENLSDEDKDLLRSELIKESQIVSSISTPTPTPTSSKGKGKGEDVNFYISLYGEDKVLEIITKYLIANQNGNLGRQIHDNTPQSVKDEIIQYGGKIVESYNDSISIGKVCVQQPVENGIDETIEKHWANRDCDDYITRTEFRKMQDEISSTDNKKDLIDGILKTKPNPDNFDLQPYGYINALYAYIEKLEDVVK